jgi:hypothetical protein
MFIIEDRVSGLEALVLFVGQLFKVLTSGRVARIMMMIAVRLRNWVVRTGLVIFELVGVILSEC